MSVWVTFWTETAELILLMVVWKENWDCSSHENLLTWLLLFLNYCQGGWFLPQTGRREECFFSIYICFPLEEDVGDSSYSQEQQALIQLFLKLCLKKMRGKKGGTVGWQFLFSRSLGYIWSNTFQNTLKETSRALLRHMFCTLGIFTFTFPIIHALKPLPHQAEASPTPMLLFVCSFNQHLQWPKFCWHSQVCTFRSLKSQQHWT